MRIDDSDKRLINVDEEQRKDRISSVKKMLKDITGDKTEESPEKSVT